MASGPSSESGDRPGGDRGAGSVKYSGTYTGKQKTHITVLKTPSGLSMKSSGSSSSSRRGHLQHARACPARGYDMPTPSYILVVICSFAILPILQCHSKHAPRLTRRQPHASSSCIKMTPSFLSSLSLPSCAKSSGSFPSSSSMGVLLITTLSGSM